MKGAPPDLDALGMPTLGNLESMHASFRLALQQLARYVREAKHGDPARLGKVSKQLARDCLAEKPRGETFEADCDHCGTSNVVKASAESARCKKCKKQFALELV